MLTIPLKGHKIHTERMTSLVKQLVSDPTKLSVSVEWDKETLSPIEARIEYDGEDPLPEDLADRIRAMGKAETKTDFEEAPEESDAEKMLKAFSALRERLERLEDAFSKGDLGKRP